MGFLERLGRDKEIVFYVVISSLVFIFIFFVLLNYDMNWMHPEAASMQMPYVFENGRNFLPQDFLRSFNYLAFDLNPRSRFLSYLFQIVNFKFRNWLFNFVPPHPSFSLTWIFTLILSPIFLFKLVNNLTLNRVTSWLAVLLYMVSPGLLSLTTMLFHPAKPLSNFFAIFCLYLASQIRLSVSKEGGFGKGPVCLYIILLISLFLAFIADETAYFIFLCIPVMFPEMFRAKDKGRVIILWYCFILASFLAFVSFVCPLIIKYMRFQNYGLRISGFDYLGYFIFTISRLSIQQQTFWELIGLKNLFLNGHYFLSSHINPFRMPDPSSFFKSDIYFYLPFLIYFICSFKLLSHPEKKLIKRISIALLLFIVFHYLLFIGFANATPDCYYYGSHFSIFFAILMAVFLSQKHGLLKVFNKIILIFLIVVCAFNFYSINKRWNYSHTKFYKAFFAVETENMPEEKALTYPMVLRAWQNRKDYKSLLALKEQFPKRAYWLFVELEYLKR